ncbi:SNF2 family N-terminal domain-containing protein [Scheffersomyces amazonensis]|uniref:SNF2 family N-terminal domain-containing protein n=1 Tax=Scheffersomyces amazonensis TaxID=1078765 RepID=UPI00315C823E
MVLQLIDFNFDNICKLIAINRETPQKSKKRPKTSHSYRNGLAIDNLKYTEYYKSARINNELQPKKSLHEELITLAERSFNFKQECPINLLEDDENLTGNFSKLSEISSNVYEFIIDDIKLSFDNNHGLLYIKTNSVNIYPNILLSINCIDFTNTEVSLFKQELTLINYNITKRERNSITINEPTLKLVFNRNTNEIQVSVYYSIFYSSGSIAGNQVEKISSMLSQRLQEYPIINEQKSFTQFNESEPVSAKLFYTAISESTELKPKIEDEFDIPELSTNLIRFQKKAVNWLLEKENVMYDFESNRCKPLDFIDSETLELFNKLNHTNEELQTMDNKILLLLNRLCFGYRRVRLDGKIYFFNRLSAHILSRNGACKYLLEHKDQQLSAQALLCEEMGLGKTVEMTALILMNQRSTNEVNDTFEHQINQFGDIKSIVKAKTTLVIAPDSILKQWVEEIVHLAPSLAVTTYHGIGKYPKLDDNAALIAEYLRKFDVVFTTYATISKELDYALYSSRPKHTRNAKLQRTSYSMEEEEDINQNLEQEVDESALLNDYQSKFQLTLTSKKPKVANMKSGNSKYETDYEKALQDEISLAIQTNRIPSIYKKVEYESPLMLSQFWRVILDEVQMVSSTVSRAFQTAALIPRFHAWGVSGTPIKKNLEDLHSILHFLKYQPFCFDYGKIAWENITKNNSNVDFINLWTSISLRHTKSMVHDDIKLPPQSRILLTIPFTPVEQDFYNQKFEECLATICLDINGNPISEDWEPSATIMLYMRNWLVTLRQICCNPQIGRLSISSKRYKRNNAYSRLINSIQQLKTLENLLDDMLSKAYNEIIDNEKLLIQLYLEVGEFFEFCYLPEQALPFLNIGVCQTERIIHRSKLILQKYIKEFKEYRRKLDTTIIKDEDDEDEDDDAIGSIDGKNEIKSKSENDEVLEKLEDKIIASRMRVRAWTTTLHRFYFLIASSYFQRYDKEYSEVMSSYKVPENQIRFNLLDKFQTYQESQRSDEIASLVNGVDLESPSNKFEIQNYAKDFKVEPIWSEDECKEEEIKYLESKFYELAESTRGELLQGTIYNVNLSVETRIKSRGWYLDLVDAYSDKGDTLLPKNSKKFFSAIPLIDTDAFADHSIVMKVKIFCDKLYKIVDELNKQAIEINNWMKDLIRILCTPVLTQDKSPAGTEYEETIQDQDKVSSYLFVLAQALIDRGEYVNGAENSAKIITIKRAQEKKENELEMSKINDQAFLMDLQKTRSQIKPKGKTSLQELVLFFKAMESEIQDDKEIRNDVQLSLLEDLGQRLRNVFDNQKLALVLLQKELSVNCNAVFNSRIDYYKQLQQISDTVQTSDFGMNRTKLDVTKINIHLQQIKLQHEELKIRMDKSIAKFRYLRSLVGVSDGNEEEAMMCIICRSTITIGTLTQCGHKYCKDCLEQWLRNSHSCPMCKTPITIKSVYSFTHHKPNLKANQVEDTKNHNSNLFSIYKPLPKEVIEEIQGIKLKNSYSSKVNMIVKQVLYLRSQNPDVQIVVYSQWQDMLYILGTAFKAADISFLGSYGTLRTDTGAGRKVKMYDSVETFKDPNNRITCFLLNAKAQASGLTLINATHIFLCEPLVNTSLELQAISRIHRIGQTKPTTVWMFAIENSVEESIVVMSTNKRLQYMEEQTPGPPQLRENSINDTSAASMIAKANEKSLSKAESLTLMNSAGNDTLVAKGVGQGESVTNFDLWAAFFSARTKSSSTDVSKENNNGK